MKRWVKVGVLAVAAASGVMESNAAAQEQGANPAPGSPEVEQLRKQNAELQGRLDQLAKDLEELKGKVNQNGKQPAESPAKLSVTSSVGIDLYGFVKLDASHDSQANSFGDYLRWVNSEQNIKDIHPFNMTANETRLGARLKGPESDNIRLNGDVEMDFYSFVGSEDTPSPRMRYAYVNSEFPKIGLSVLAGQAPDVISPLIQPTVNFAVGWWMGDIGFRRPQLRLTEDINLDKDVKLKLEAAATRTVASSFLGGTDFSTDPGQEAGFPAVQGRASLTFPGLSKLPTLFGVWGHWGNERHDLTNTTMVANNHFTVNSWSLGYDGVIPFTPWLKVQTSGYFGQDLDTYLGGIGQGANGILRKGIGDRGVWAVVTLGPFGRKEYEYSPTAIGRGLPISGPWGRWVFNFGWTRTWVKSGDLTGLPSARAANGAEFGNVYFEVTRHLSVGLELMHARTAYKALAAGDDWREQLGVIYTF